MIGKERGRVPRISKVRPSESLSGLVRGRVQGPTISAGA